MEIATTLSLRAIRELAAEATGRQDTEVMTDEDLLDATGIVWAQYEARSESGAYHYACMIEDPGNFEGFQLASFYVKCDPFAGVFSGSFGGNGYATNPHDDDDTKAQLKTMEIRKDDAYHERNKVVAALARLFPSGLGKTDIPGWSEDWHNCVYIDTPVGQMSWHFHDSQMCLFEDLPKYSKAYDGHTTLEKYDRLAKLRRWHLSAPGPAPGNGMPDWPEDMHFAGRCAYQRGVADERGMSNPLIKNQARYEFLREQVVRHGALPKELRRVFIDVCATNTEFDEAVDAARSRNQGETK